jgi:hypothetical protein
MERDWIGAALRRLGWARTRPISLRQRCKTPQLEGLEDRQLTSFVLGAVFLTGTNRQPSPAGDREDDGQTAPPRSS